MSQLHDRLSSVEYLFKGPLLERVFLVGKGRGVGTEEQLERAASWLEKWLDGSDAPFPYPLAMDRLTEFTRQALETIGRIPRGEVASYKEIAETMGCPKGARAVGLACNRNPFPLIIPCHRVIASDGTMGGFAVGLEMKRALLGHEQLLRV